MLDKLTDYRAIEFDWIGSGNHDVGVIAQELYDIFLEIVHKGSDEGEIIDDITDPDVWGVQYSKLGALALQGVKELNLNLKAAIKAQQIELANTLIELAEKDCRIDAMASDLADTQARLTALENVVRKMNHPARASTLGMAPPALAMLGLLGLAAIGRTRRGGVR